MKRLSIAALVLSTTLVACTAETTTTDSLPADTTTAPVETAPVVDDDEMVDIEDVDLPSPLQIASILNEAGMNHQADLGHDPALAGGYATFNQKAMNFGVYNGDLNYCVMNGETERSTAYLQAIHQLADDLGFSSIMDGEAMLATLEENVDDQEALNDMLEEMEDNLEEYMEMNEIKYVMPVVFAGGFVENMYLASMSLSAEGNDELESRLVREMRILDNLLEGLNANPDKDATLETLIIDLEAVKSTYKNFAIVADLGEGNDDNLTITDEELTALSGALTTARNHMIGAN